MSSLPVPLNVLADHDAILQAISSQFRTGSPLSSLPVANPTQSFWLRSANVVPAPTHGSDGPLTSDADICIIGSGITGVSAAYHLAKLFSTNYGHGSVSVVMLEARDFCSGATGRNGGHLTADVFGSFRRLQEAYGREEAIRSLAIEHYTAAEVLKVLQEHEKVDHVDFVPGGRVILLFTTQEYDEVHADYVAAKVAGIDMTGVEWLTREQVEQRFGASYPAVLIPGNNLWPLKLASVLYKLAETSSPDFTLSLHTRTPATSISPLHPPTSTDGSDTPTPPRRRWTVHTPRGPITCAYVLHATNAYAAHLLPSLHDVIVPTRGQVTAVRAASPTALGRSGFLANDGFEYWFPRPARVGEEERGQLVILGGGREAAEDGRHEFGQTDDSVVDPAVGRVLRRFLPAVFPRRFEEGEEPEMEWTGIMGFTKSGNPLVGPVVDPADPQSIQKYEGQYISAGYSGHGMPRAFACTKVVAGMIHADMHGTKWAQPEWFPSHFLTTKDVSA